MSDVYSILMGLDTKIYFLCFAGGGRRYLEAQKRLVNQVNKLKFFDVIIDAGVEDLNREYFKIFGKIFEKYPRGCGLWSWKPWLINRYLSTMNHGDILFYVDCGFEVNRNATNELHNYIEIVKSSKLLIFNNGTKHSDFTKPDIRILKPADAGRNQISAAFIAIEKCNFTQDIISKWLELCSENNGELLTDELIINDKILEFKFHRHDQSILTRVLYDQKFVPLYPDQTFNSNWNELISSPFINFRNYSKKSVINYELPRGWRKGIVLILKELISLSRKFH
jgi:hypothetical protein